MLTILEKFNDPSKLKRILVELHTRMSNEVKVKHFLMTLSLEKMIEDVEKLSIFLLEKNPKDYTDSPLQTIERENQVSAMTYKEICLILVQILQEESIEEDDLPNLVTNIMACLEESRVQGLDRITTIYRIEDLSPEHIIEIFDKARIRAAVDDDNFVVTGQGTAVPVYLKLQKKHENLVIACKAEARVDALPPVQALADQINGAYPFFQVSAIEKDEDIFLYAEHKFNAKHGVPARFLIRDTKEFANYFQTVLRLDQDKVCKA